MLTYFNFTKQGKSHIRNNRECQDYSLVKSITLNGTEYIVGGIADGLGSCVNSRKGAQVLVNSALHIIMNALTSPGFSEDEIADALQTAFICAGKEIEKVANDDNMTIVTYDSTLTVTVYNGKTLWFGHIGDDGIVAVKKDGTYKLITARHKGEYANSVKPFRSFDLWQFGVCEDCVAFASMTDGVLDYFVGSDAYHNRVYYPFFAPFLFDSLAQEETSDFIASLEKYLDSQPIVDDITVLAAQNSEDVKKLPDIVFSQEEWEEESRERMEQLKSRRERINYNKPSEQEKEAIFPAIPEILDCVSFALSKGSEISKELADKLRDKKFTPHSAEFKNDRKDE